MRSGKIEQLDTPGQIYRNPVNEFVADFVGDVSLLECEYDATRHGVTVGAEFVALPLEDAPRCITLVVRPENVRLARSEEGGGLPGRVEDIAYQAGTTLYSVRLASGALLKSRGLGAPSPEFGLGTALRAHVGDCHIAFPRGNGS
jgi:ABC-type Fe3+/spermidine/putrescine transport system ATPase subunit